MKDNFILLVFSLLFIFFSFVLYFSISSIPPYQDIDSKAYIYNAKRIYDNNLFSSVASKKDDPYYALGYAFFIGLIYKLFGINNNFVVFIQILLALLTGFLVFRATKFLFNKTIALISFIFFSFNIGFLVFSQFILTEILLTFLLALFFERFAYFLKKDSISSLIQSGLILGISVAVKPAAIYFIFPLFFLILFMNRSFSGFVNKAILLKSEEKLSSEDLFLIKNKLFYKIKLIFFLSVSFYLPIIGYMFFNKINFDNFSVAPLANENLYLYLFPKVIAYKNNTDWIIEKRKIGSLLTGSKLNEKSWSKIKEKFYEYFKKDPIIFLQIWLKNVFKTCVGLFTTNLKVLIERDVKGGDISFFKMEGNFFKRIFDYITCGTKNPLIKIVGVFEAIWSVLRYILCLIALFFLVFKKKWLTFFFFFFYLFYFSMITGHDGCARFRMMFEPVLLVLASFGLWVIVRAYMKTQIILQRRSS
ncbi:glycosyltransferase family 39 protein [Candidatus Babeliales bacterium]|nr:glycosyltransferase family 39 protein [Candidatus Babeliales bacterium]